MKKLNRNRINIKSDEFVTNIITLMDGIMDQISYQHLNRVNESNQTNFFFFFQKRSINESAKRTLGTTE